MKATVVILLLATGCLGTTKNLHDPYDKLLKAYVLDGVVDYSGMKKKEKDLDAYLAKLATEDVAKLTEKGRLAYWINAYNAFTLKLILTEWPGVKSIQDLEKPWDRKKWKAGGKVYSLTAIEHEIIRKKFDEPRIHFALVCAAVSCPDLRSEAYTARKLDAQLKEATKAFLADTKRGFRRPKKGEKQDRIFLSRLFKWYADDFEIDKKTKIDWLLAYLPEKDRKWVEAVKGDLTIVFLDYDWSLNGK